MTNEQRLKANQIIKEYQDLLYFGFFYLILLIFQK